jgi:BNR repeat-containing family member
MKRLMFVMLVFFIPFVARFAQADWGPVQRLTWTSGDSFSPATAVDSKNAVHVVWSDYTPGNAEIYYKKSGDGGASWGSTKRLTWTSGDCYEPAIAIDSNDTIHVVWDSDAPGNYEIFYKRSSDGGASWTATQRLTASSGWSEYPAIGVDSNNTISVVWQDSLPGNLEIYCRQSTNGGTNWGAVKRLTWTSGWSEYPAMAIASGNTIYVAWDDDTPGSSEIYYKKSTDGGTTWGASKRLTWTSGLSFSPAIGTNSSNAIHVAWYDQTPGNYEIYYRRSTDGGTSWSAVQRLTWNSGPSEYPAIAATLGNTVYFTWDDDTPGNLEVYCKKSTDGGSTWSAAKRLTSTAGSSSVSALAVDSGGTAHVVWEEYVSGNSEIYYKKGT